MYSYMDYGHEEENNSTIYGKILGSKEISWLLISHSKKTSIYNFISNGWFRRLLWSYSLSAWENLKHQ